jgi:hypothetical protein
MTIMPGLRPKRSAIPVADGGVVLTTASSSVDVPCSAVILQYREVTLYPTLVAGKGVHWKVEPTPQAFRAVQQ